ncbi:MAG: hypothetical protein QOF01_2859 [Thermomicrobiales bacterium]|jgi:plastocyanin|nr:hypothetical protein [Thermomicrobiales bacterium]
MAQEATATEYEPLDDAQPRPSRRRLLRQAVGGAGFLALAGSSALTIHQATAKDGDDDDNSGKGSGDDDGDHSGHGGGGDENDAPVITGEIPAGSIEVWIVDDDANGFSPGNLTVDAGQSVTFVNADDDPHTATGSGFDTGTIQPGGTATVVLDKPGTFAYACQIHPEMTGSIGVRGADDEVPPPAENTAPAGATTVQIVNFGFDPPALTVPVGTTLAWTNNDAAPHTVTALDGTFDSGIFDPGGGFSWEFTTPGTFPYRCNLHPQMEGTVEVTGDALPTQDATPAATDGEATTTAGGLIGSWMVALVPASGAELSPLQALATFHADGTLEATYAATSDGESGLGFALGPAHGAWTDDGKGTFRVTSIAFLLDGEQRFAGTLTIHEDVQVDATGDAYRGTFNLKAKGAGGEELATGEGATEGDRVGTDEGTPTAQATPPADSGQANSATVTIQGFAFEPPTLEVPVGTTVTWTNEDVAPHTATAEDGAFDTGQLDEGQDASHTFDQPGSYAYRCDFHPEMQGTVVVS